MKNPQIAFMCLLMSVLMVLTIIPVNMTASEPVESAPEPTTRADSSRGGLPNTIWPSFRGDFANTGNTTAPGLGYYYLDWSVSLGIYWGSPVVMYDQIYVAGANPSRLYCYDLDGNSVWTFTVGSQYSTPLVYDGRVYFAAGNGRLYCLDANATGTGTTTNYWTYNGATSSSTSPTTDGTRVYYSVNAASGLHAVWITNGTKAWNASRDGSTTTESSPSYWNGRVYCGGGDSWGSGNRNLYCFNASDGKLLWKYQAGGVICSTPAVEYGNVYFGAYNGRIYSVDAEGSGGSTTKNWDYSTTSTTFGVVSSAAVAYGAVYIGGTNDHIYSLGAHGSSGSTNTNWDKTTAATTYGLSSSPAVTPEYVYIGTTGGEILCRNRTTGNSEWSKSFTGITYGVMSPAVYKDHIIISADNGNLYMIRPDLTSPKIASTDPADDAVDVDPSTAITLTFDEELDVSTLSASVITLVNSSSGTISGAITHDMAGPNYDVIFTPDSALEKEETYTLTVTTDLTDLRGNTLDGNGNGIAEGVGVDEFSMSFSTPAHGKPIISTIPTQKPTEDVSYLIDLSLYVSDSDTPDNELVITQNSTYGSLDGLDLTLLYPNGVLYDLVNVTVKDNIFTVYKEIDVEVISVNDKPVISTINTLKLKEDITYFLDMKNHITDVDTPYGDLRISDNSKYTKINELVINLTYPEGVTSEEVNVTLFDDAHTVWVDIDVDIAPVNDPPVFKQVPELYVTEDEEREISLSNYVSDIDTPKDYLEIIIDSPYVKVDGFKIKLTYPEKVQEDELLMSLYDGEYYDNITVKVIVEPVNDPPEIISINSPLDGLTYDHNQTIDFTAEVYDPDVEFGDTLSFTWHSTIDRQIADTQNATGLSLTAGSHEITFTVTDASGSTVSASVDIFVNPKPDEKDPDPGDDVTDDDEGGETNRTSVPTEKESPMVALGLLAVVIIVVVIIALMMFMRKKKEDEKKAKAQAEAQAQAQLQAQIQAQAQLEAQAAMGMAYPQEQMGMADPYQQQQQLAAYPDQAQYPDQYPMQQVPGMGYPEQLPGQVAYPEYQQPVDQTQYYDEYGQVVQPYDQSQFQDQAVGQVPMLPEQIPPPEGTVMPEDPTGQPLQFDTLPPEPDQPPATQPPTQLQTKRVNNTQQ